MPDDIRRPVSIAGMRTHNAQPASSIYIGQRTAGANHAAVRAIG